MNVLFTFDVEVWCNSWKTLDSDFPTSFERYVFGRSAKGEYALPKTLETLNQHGLKGVFFVEPLFAARFGVAHLATIVKLIQDAGHEIQLHLHPEWTDEARQPLLPNVPGKRQFLTDYSADEQRALIGHGLRLLEEAGCSRAPIAFRSGGFSCNEHTFPAVAANGLTFDSSINPEMRTSQPGNTAPAHASPYEAFTLEGLSLFPMSSFRDGLGKNRHAQIGACSAREITQALTNAERQHWHTFVLLSHSFELMIPDRSTPDPIVVRRFEHVCRFLAANRATLPTVGFHDLPPLPAPCNPPLPTAGKLATATRYAEQALRRLYQ